MTIPTNVATAQQIQSYVDQRIRPHSEILRSIYTSVTNDKGTIDDIYTALTLSEGITNASNASPIVITSAAHGLSTGGQVTITGVGGNTNANGTFVITVVSVNTFSLNGTTGNSNYTSGGTWNLVNVWVDTRSDGPPHILGSADVLSYNSFITAFVSFIEGNGDWATILRACVRPQ